MRRRTERGFRELRRIRFSKGRAGSATGRFSENFFGDLLLELRRERRINDFEKIPKYSPEDSWGIDFYVYSLKGRKYKVDVKSSGIWIGRKIPNTVYIIVGLCPDKEKILEQLRKEGII